MKVTGRDLHRIFLQNRDIDYKNVVNFVEDSLGVNLNEYNSERVFASLKQNKQRWFSKKKLKFDPEVYEEKMENDTTDGGDNCFMEIDISEPILVDGDEKPSIKKRKAFKDLDRKQRLRRTKVIWEDINKKAEEEDIKVEELLGFLLSRCSGKEQQDVGKTLFNAEHVMEKTIPVITALTIYCDCNLGRLSYTKQRRLLAAVGFPIFPPWSRLRELQGSITPPVLTLPEPNHGVYFPMLKAVETTIVRVFEDGDLELQSSQLKLKMKYGFDGSGSHAIDKRIT